MIINKYYVDIEIAYAGTKSLEDQSTFRDWADWKFDTGGLFGILCLEIDTDSKTKKELFCKQIEWPNVDQILENEIPSICDRNKDDMLVTWNGRSFDIPIMIENMEKNVETKVDVLSDIFYKDRDLLDSALHRGLSVKGGLGEICKRLGVQIDSTGKDVPIEIFNQSFDYIVQNKDNPNTDAYKKAKDIVSDRNEYDIRSLPLLEECLGLLYDGKKDEDAFHKVWSNSRQTDYLINKVITESRQQM